ncbi:MAG TPA: tetratricopeptide repeat protein [Candidatus Saccharimonadales bacterium]|nr:tetratricopeptide repeat protein [Candidatus Saccharimonadales bacterium]
MAGWDWRPAFHQPLLFLLSLPIRLLPPGWQLVAGSLFSAICASLALVLLARSVAILPHDRTRDQRGLERSDYSFLTIPLSWLPPAFAVLVCAFQLSFWENAIGPSSEPLDLLVFAYLVRCLLEYRISHKESWLYRLALVYGLGMTNNFALIAFLPAFCIALVWIAGRNLINSKLLMRLAGLGLIGLLLYLLLPICNSMFGVEEVSFWVALKSNLGNQKNFVLHYPKIVILLVSLTSVVPVAFMGIRWPASFGDINAAGNALTNLMMHVIHAVFLLACLYVSFDPSFSPRKLTGEMLAFLPLYYLGALSVGYYSGYFLLVFKPGPAQRGWPRTSTFRKALNYSILGLVLLAAVAAPVRLVWLNLPKVKVAAGKDLSKFGTLALESLPPQGAIVMSDDPYRLFSLYGALVARGLQEKYVLVETAPLSQPFYQKHLKKVYGERWPEIPAGLKKTALIDPRTTIQMLHGESAKGREIYYLHPSFGYYFESFYQVPRGAICQLKPLAEGTVVSAALAEEGIKTTLDYWKRVSDGELQSLRKKPEATRKKLKAANVPADMVAMFYSRVLNFAGSEIKRAGHLQEAGELFALAREFNPRNPAARINDDFNKQLLAGKPEPGKYDAETTALLNEYKTMDALLGAGGPVDEPSFCLMLAGIFENGQNFKQAAQQMLRVQAYKPEEPVVKISLARLYIRAGLFDRGLEEIAALRAMPGVLRPESNLELVQYEAWGYSGKSDLAKAEKTLKGALAESPGNESILNTLIEIYMSNGRLTNAFSVLQDQIQARPDDVNPRINYSALKIRAGAFEDAITMASEALKLESTNTFALMNRAIAGLQAGHFDQAEKDYQRLLTLLPKPPYSIYYGLGEIAYQKKNKKDALNNYDKYLELIPAGSPEERLIREKIKALKRET